MNRILTNIAGVALLLAITGIAATIYVQHGDQKKYEPRKDTAVVFLGGISTSLGRQIDSIKFNGG
jgi:hypothetical protein